MKGKNAFDRLAHPCGDRECDSRLRAQLAPLQLQPEFKKEQFFKNEPPLRRCAEIKQLPQIFAGLWPMGLVKGLQARREIQSFSDGLRDRIGNLRLELFEGAINGVAKPARGQLPLTSRFINRHNSPDLE